MNHSEKLPDSLYFRKKYPSLIHVVNFIYSGLNIFLNRIFTSRLNPLSQTGAWSVFFLSTTFISGAVLVLFYKISDPYSSLVNIQEMTFITKWVRAMHRYSADAALITITLHVFRSMVEGKTWGARLFSWLTGVFNTGLLFVSVYTGYVMAWDDHARAIVVRGAQLFDYLHFTPESISAMFSGEKNPDATFFFVNLFAHVAVPLAMAIMLWLHTSRLTRPDFFPAKKHMWVAGIVLFFISFFISAPMIKKADLFSIGTDFQIDFFYSSWLFFSQENFLKIMAFYLFGLPVILFLVPLVWRPRGKIKKEEFVSVVNLEKCNGSGQCSQDCPYGAIIMKNREEKGSGEQYAFVDENRCVGCGICSASCRVFAIGPKGKTGVDILHDLKSFISSCESNQGQGKDRVKKEVLVFSCAYNEKVNEYLGKSGGQNFETYETPCNGILHATHIHSALNYFSRIVMASCSESQCVFRFGSKFAGERIEGSRMPTLPDLQNRERVKIWTGSSENLSDLKNMIENKQPAKPARWRMALGVGFLLLFFGSVAGASQIYVPSGSDEGMLRMSWKLTGQRQEDCRDLSEKEILARPKHMRKSRECSEIYYSYMLRYKIGDVTGQESIQPAGMRKDRPLLIFKEIKLKPGTYAVDIEFSTREVSAQKFSFSGNVQINPNKVALITRNKNEQEFIVKYR